MPSIGVSIFSKPLLDIHMIECTFELNDKPMSAFKIGALSFPAFSGLRSYANQRASVCRASVGAIPPGRYYIMDREAGGILGPIKDFFRGKDDWFALYADDGRIDDETFCEKVKRGNFRLHPRGLAGISEGCITLDNVLDFYRVRAILKGSGTFNIPGTSLHSYGRVVVK